MGTHFAACMLVYFALKHYEECVHICVPGLKRCIFNVCCCHLTFNWWMAQWSKTKRTRPFQGYVKPSEQPKISLHWHTFLWQRFVLWLSKQYPWLTSELDKDFLKVIYLSDIMNSHCWWTLSLIWLKAAHFIQKDVIYYLFNSQLCIYLSPVLRWCALARCCFCLHAW